MNLKSISIKYAQVFLFVIYAYMLILFNLEYIMCKGMCPEEERYTSHCHLSAAALNNHPVQPKNYKKMDFQGGRGRKKYAQVFLFVIYAYMFILFNCLCSYSLV